MKVTLVVATRAKQENFFSDTALGRSLHKQQPHGVEIRLFPENTRGLSEVYNTIIDEPLAPSQTLIFLHDDIHLLDFYWINRLEQGLQVFDIVGLAGNTRRLPKQSAWAFVHDSKNQRKWDSPEHLSGVVAHGKAFPPDIWSVFGPSRQKVMLLDGLLLAVKYQSLTESGLRFDPQFRFHFYDMDFCRQAEKLGLSCGTWDICVMHESGGKFGEDEWLNAYQTYLKKWGD